MNDPNQNSAIPVGRTGNTAAKGPIIPKSPNEALKPERVPDPPRRSRKARSQLVIFLNFLMTLAVGVSVLAVAGFYYIMNTYQAPGPLRNNATLQIRSGAGLAEIAQALERNGIVSDARIFRYVTATNLADGETLKAGEYEFKAGASMRDIMELLKSGKSILYSISFPEGLTVAQMFKRLKEDPALEGPMPADMPPEGSLRPDTYKFERGSNRADIVARMRAAQENLVDELWARRDPDLPLKSKEELVTLASIVEKETGKADERAHVASVFINRLRKGMRLQSDPTIVYGIFGGEGKPSDRPIYQSDLQKETPYNTYLIRGLPPGPIANPGRDALEATANPWRTNDLYFVADGTGGHAFATNLDDHNANVRRWRRLEAEKGADPNIAVDGQPGEDAPSGNQGATQGTRKR